MKKTQNYANHTNWVPTFHYYTYAGILVSLIGAIIYCFKGENNPTLLSLILFILILTIGSIAFHARWFALKAQDRAIRAEESLRYFILTGKRIDQNLKMSQFVALRFASDEEFVELVERAVKENMSSKEIKMAIKNWRGDYKRV